MHFDLITCIRSKALKIATASISITMNMIMNYDSDNVNGSGQIQWCLKYQLYEFTLINLV